MKRHSHYFYTCSLIVTCCGLLQSSAFAADILEVQNGNFEQPGDTWKTGGGSPTGWKVRQHEVKTGKGGSRGEAAGTIGLNHRWNPMTKASPRSLYLIDPIEAIVSQELKGTMSEGCAYDISYGVFRYDREPAKAIMRLKVGDQTVLEDTVADGDFPYREWVKRELTYTPSSDDTDQPVTLEFEITGKGDVRLDEVAITTLTPDLLQARKQIEPLAESVAALPVSTAAEKRKKAALEIALEQIELALQAGLTDQAKNLISDVEQALPQALGELTTPKRGIGFHPELEVWEGNPYVESLLKWAKKELANDDIPFPMGTSKNPLFTKLNGDYGSRSEAANMNRLLWLAAHPQSPYRENPEIIKRLLRRAHAYMNEYAAYKTKSRARKSHLNDFFALGPAFDAINGITEAFPDLVLPSQKAKWEQAAGLARETVLNQIKQTNNALYPVGKYTNRDIGYANILLNAAVFLQDEQNIAEAKRIIDLQEANVFPDGAYGYIGAQNESGSYHQVVTNFLGVFYARSGHEKTLDLLRDSHPYAALSIEPGNVPEYYTVPYWKTAWNSGYGEGGESVATLSGDPYVRGLIDQRHKYNGGASPDPLAGSWFRKGIEAKPLPTDYMVLDRNVQGPRGRWGRFSFVFNGRNYWDREPGKLTLVGAMVVDPIDEKRHPLNAALKAVYPKVQVMKKSGDEWRDWAYLATKEKNSSSVSKNAVGLTSSYDMHTTVPGHKVKDQPWQGKQQWIGLPGRIVGVVEVAPAGGEQEAYQIDGRIRLGYGRSGPLRPKEMKAVDNNNYEYGDLRVTLHEHNYASTDMAASGIIRDAVPQATEIRLHDDKSQADDAEKLKTYSPDEPYFFAVEVRPEWSPAAEEIDVIRLDSGLRGLRVQEEKRDLVLIHNPTDASQTYGAKHSLKEGQKAVVVHSGPESKPSPLEIPASGQIELEIAPHQHALIVMSSDPNDLKAAAENFEEIAYSEAP